MNRTEEDPGGIEMIRRSLATAALLAGAVTFFAGVYCEAADQKGKPPTTLLAKTPPPIAAAIKPNLSVGSVWIGSGSGDRFAALGRAPRLGETVSLACRVNLMGKPAPGWKMAWYVDGVKTCGEGTYTVTQADCEFPWQISIGTDVFIDYVPHQTGSHTFRCAVDIGGTVAEASELDNAKQVSFNVVLPLQKVPDETIPITRAPIGPRLRRTR